MDNPIVFDMVDCETQEIVDSPIPKVTRTFRLIICTENKVET